MAVLALAASGCATSAGAELTDETDSEASDDANDGVANDTAADSTGNTALCTSPAASLVVTPPADAPVREGASVQYSAVLGHPPCAEGTVLLTSEGQVSTPPAVTFGPSNWDVPQTIELGAVHDFEQEGEHTGTVQHAIESGDTAYRDLSVDDVTLTIVDRAHTTLVSANPYGAPSNASSFAARVSDDGAWVAFVSRASDLVVGDAPNIEDVFRRDMVAGVTTRISQLDTGVGGDGPSFTLDMSADGSVVAFVSVATNLSEELVCETTGEIYSWTQANGLRLETTPGSDCGYSDVILPQVALSSNGAYLAYSTVRPMAPTDDDIAFDVYTVELASGAISHDSIDRVLSPDGAYTSFGSTMQPALSSSGSFVGFAASDRELDAENQQTYVVDRNTGTLTRLTDHHDTSTACVAPQPQDSPSHEVRVSTDGTVAAFDTHCPLELAPESAPDTNELFDVFVRDISTLTTTRISVGHDGTETDGASKLHGISDDARYVLFSSEASNLVPNDTNGQPDLFVHDRETSETTRVSYGPAYEELPSGIEFSDMSSPAISTNGAWVVFGAFAAELLAGNTEDPPSESEPVANLYRVQLHPG